jgi:HSP20 family protein
MEKKKEDEINVKKKAEKTSVKKSSSPQVWRPLDILEDVDCLFSEEPWFSPLWGGWGYCSPKLGLNVDNDTKFVPLDLLDNGKEYKVIAEIPGVSKENIEVNITKDSLSICGKTETYIKNENEGVIRRERSYSTLCRNLRFPEAVNPDKAVATLNNGILEINVPKIKSKSKGRTIPIK